VAELVDAEIIPSEIQWYGESPCKILVTHYRFKSCPDYIRFQMSPKALDFFGDESKEGTRPILLIFLLIL